MTIEQVMIKLKSFANEDTVRVYNNREMELEILGVKIADIKKLAKQIKINHELSLELYETGIYEAMYLAGLVADETKMTKDILNTWIRTAGSYLIAEYTIPWIAVESDYGLELALEWIDSDDELTAAAGWSCMSSLVMTKDDSDLDYDLLLSLLHRVSDKIKTGMNREKYAMNGFVIALAGGYKTLFEEAKKIAVQNGKITVYMGKTSCKVPFAPDYIEKMKKRGYIGKKRKQIRC